MLISPTVAEEPCLIGFSLQPFLGGSRGESGFADHQNKHTFCSANSAVEFTSSRCRANSWAATPEITAAPCQSSDFVERKWESSDEKGWTESCFQIYLKIFQMFLQCLCGWIHISGWFGLPDNLSERRAKIQVMMSALLPIYRVFACYSFVTSVNETQHKSHIWKRFKRLKSSEGFG